MLRHAALRTDMLSKSAGVMVPLGFEMVTRMAASKPGSVTVCAWEKIGSCEKIAIERDRKKTITADGELRIWM